jgi:endonuclease I
MKKNYFFALLFVFSLGFAQAPANYYNSATGTGYALKTQLYNIIKDHVDQGYAGLYTTYQTSDVRSTGKVWDMYSDCVFTFGTVANGGNQDNGTNPAGECVFFNREHSIPQSYFGNGTLPMYADAHFVIPSDKVVNAQRDDFPYGVVQTPTYTSANGSKKGNNLNSGYSAGYSSTVFEPVDQYKGDIARLLFYFATRYENLLTSFYSTTTSTSKAMFNGTSNQSFSPTFLNILLTWNAQDPVSAKEIARNNAIYARQNNRNPFIDNNGYVTSIWGNPLQTNTFNVLADVSVYPNPSSENKINIETTSEVNSIVLVTINGQIMQQIENPTKIDNTITLDNLSKGFYFLRINSQNQSITKKVIIN